MTEALRLRLERLAWALAVHGAWQVPRREVTALADGPLAVELMALLREYFTKAEISQLVGRHPDGCPCWDCVLALHRWVKRTAASHARKGGKRRRPPMVKST